MKDLEIKVKEWLSNGKAKEWPEIVDFISSLLSQQRKEVLDRLPSRKEFEDAYGITERQTLYREIIKSLINKQ